MSLTIAKFIGAIFLAVIILLIAQQNLKSKQKVTIKTIIIVLVLSLPTVILYRTEYNMFVSIVTYILAIILFKNYFKISLLSSIYICSYGIILVGVTDIIVSIKNTIFLTYEELRTSTFLILENTLLIGCIAYLISIIPAIKNKVNYIYVKIEKTPKYNVITFMVICLFTIIIAFFNISEIFKLNTHFIVTIVSILFLFILYYFYISELNNYGRLKDKYEILFDYVQTFEDWIEDEQLYRHELKNSLSMIRDMTKNKKIIKKIDDMLKMNINIDDEYIELLKYIPKGGLKGLLYYKIALAKNKKVKMVVEISPKIKTLIKKIPEDHLKQLCIILGIYLDNAIEAASISKKKLITIEIYEINNKMTFTISNTYNEIHAIKDMNRKGFTTKGNNHGRGLYYANKVLHKSDWLKSDQIYLNAFFIQKLYIK